MDKNIAVFNLLSYETQNFLTLVFNFIDFIKNSKLPLELYNVFENYKKEKDDLLNKKLIRKQLDTVSVKYDKLMEKAKIQNNTRFANFFKVIKDEEEDTK